MSEVMTFPPLSLIKKKKRYGELPITHQLFHLAACADEESLIDSQGCVDCSGIQLQLSSFCVQLIHQKQIFSIMNILKT